MKDWSLAITDDAEGDDWNTDIKGEIEDGEHLGMVCVASHFKY